MSSQNPRSLGKTERVSIDLRLYFVAWIPFIAVFALAVRMSDASWTSSLIAGVTNAALTSGLGLLLRRIMPLNATSRWQARILARHLLLGVLYTVVWAGFIVVSLYLTT